MEAELIAKILAGGGGTYFLYWLINKVAGELKGTKKEFKIMHTEAMNKFDKLTESVQELVTTSALHAKDLENGEARMDRLEARIEVIADRTHTLTDKIQIASLKVEALEKKE